MVVVNDSGRECLLDVVFAYIGRLVVDVCHFNIICDFDRDINFIRMINKLVTSEIPLHQDGGWRNSFTTSHTLSSRPGRGSVVRQRGGHESPRR